MNAEGAVRAILALLVYQGILDPIQAATLLDMATKAWVGKRLDQPLDIMIEQLNGVHNGQN